MWRDEIDKCLVFATLFSAIVTAFTIEFSKHLEVDHQESTASILFVIHQQLDSIARNNVTTLPPIIPNPASEFKPLSSTIMTNLFLLTSLILSVATAALCILCLQWLREHQRHPSGFGSPKELFPLRAHRNRLMDMWCMSAVVGVLPAILLISLFGFLLALLTMYGSTVTPSGAYFGVLIGFVLLVGCFLTALPAINRNCLFRSPQSWLLYRSLSRVARPTLTYLAHATGAATIWPRLKEHIPKPLLCCCTYFTQPGWIRDSEDWGRRDKKELESSQDPGFQWFGTTFAHDREAIRAMVRCLELKIADSRARKPDDTSRREVKVLIVQMAVLEGGEGWEFLYDVDDGVPPRWPLDLGCDVAMATCIDYATRVQESLLPLLSYHRMELHLRILRALLETPESDPTYFRSLIEDRAAVYSEHIKQIPEGFEYQICDIIWMGFETQSNYFPSCLDILRGLPPEGSHHQAVARLNQRLEARLGSSSQKEIVLRMVIPYLYKWLACHCPSRSSCGSFAGLAGAVLAAVGGFPHLQQELGGEIAYIHKWT